MIRESLPDDIDEVRALFREYERSVGGDVCFQDFDRELAGLPGAYSKPDGILLLAIVADRAAGCVAVRRIDAATSEMKRLYVREEARGLKLGRALAEAAVDFARRAGYRRMRLDTLPGMTTAQALYRTLGFRDVQPGRAPAAPEVLVMELNLSPAA